MFFCTQCGECCKHINRVPELSEYDNGNGVCIYLKDNRCSIYENRPNVCRVDYMYETLYKELISKDEFYRLNYEVCKTLIKNKT